MPIHLKTAAKAVLHFVSPTLVNKVVDYRSARKRRKTEAQEWNRRIADVLACPDNVRLPRHPEAGMVKDGLQRMFNGVKVVPDGYYGHWVTELLRRNKGSHEPQEEIVFQDVLGRLPPGATMLECGAYWGFYSLWFVTKVTEARAWLIEPEAANLEIGRRNFQANGVNATFTQAFIGRDHRSGTPPQTSVDGFLAEHAIDHLSILHADIQGAEVEMLHGARQSLSERKVDYIFISSHGEDLHDACVQLLRTFGYEVSVSIPPARSYSFDGLIVAHSPGVVTSPLPVPSEKPLPARNPKS